MLRVSDLDESSVLAPLLLYLTVVTNNGCGGGGGGGRRRRRRRRRRCDATVHTRAELLRHANQPLLSIHCVCVAMRMAEQQTHHYRPARCLERLHSCIPPDRMLCRKGMRRSQKNIVWLWSTPRRQHCAAFHDEHCLGLTSTPLPQSRTGRECCPSHSTWSQMVLLPAA
jgi:hypothetical protein